LSGARAPARSAHATLAHSVYNRLARSAYATLLRLATPLYLLRLWWRGRREPLYRVAVAQRLGISAGDGITGRLWIHAVSLGETLAASALIDALRLQSPGLRLLLTHGTATGREAGAKLLREGDAQAWLPYDTPGAVRRFLQAHQPALGVLMETEVWPVLLHEAQALRLPMVLANARLSARSLQKGQALAALMRPAVASFAAVLAQTEADAARLTAAGALTVQLSGNLKFDITPDADLMAQGQRWRAALQRPVVLAAITREGEEAPLLAAWARLATPRPLLLVVPRHPQRFDEVAALIAAAGFSVQRRSAFGDAPLAAAQADDVWLGDTMREMALYYSLADAALLGGSFAPLGGHNLIEAAACGCPLVMGPHTYNFALAAELAIEAGAALRVPDIEAGVAQALQLATANDRSAWSQRAQAFAAAHRGAAERMARVVLASMNRV
jgi:3-deoxy-D-manno-octulosonic-acid transferase